MSKKEKTEYYRIVSFDEKNVFGRVAEVSEGKNNSQITVQGEKGTKVFFTTDSKEATESMKKGKQVYFIGGDNKNQYEVLKLEND